MPSSLEVPADAVRLLVIDLTSLPEHSSRALRFELEEQTNWMACAAAESLALVVLETEHRIELYSTEGDHRRAFRNVVHALSTRVFDEPQLGLTRTRELGGDAAVRHLLRRAGGLEPSSVPYARLSGQVRAAATAASATSALGDTLGLLFRAAANVARRIRAETAFGDPAGTAALREVERLAAERILEEEFTAWQSLAGELRRSGAEEAPTKPFARSFVMEEPGSFVRARVPQRLVRSSDS